MGPRFLPGFLDEPHFHRLIDYPLFIEFEKSAILA
jgi:hypothetical protein